MAATVLLAAFEPFGGRTRNRSLDAVGRLARDGMATRTLPVSFDRLPEIVPSLVEECERALVLVGESGPARVPTLERVAINLIDARLSDNDGAAPRDRPIVERGPAAYLATWPARELADSLRAAGHRVELSAHAGTFACNAALYLALHRAASLERPPRIGFVHVPAGWWWANDRRASAVLRDVVEAMLR